MSQLNNWQSRSALNGLQRAFARDVPEGYEESSAWQADTSGTADAALMQIYRQRQQDRIDAENRARMAERGQTGLWSPDVHQSYNMGGFYEGVNHSDQVAGITNGQVTSAPKQSKVNMPLRALRGLTRTR